MEGGIFSLSFSPSLAPSLSFVNNCFLVPSFKYMEGSPGNPYEGAGGEEETRVFSLFSRSSWKLRSGSFPASLEGLPLVTDCDSEDVYAKLDSCYIVSNLKYCTSELGLLTLMPIQCGVPESVC